ncbi:MAG: restriction endonuclease [Gemmatimonadetes bacterium]|nr:restriction endonuclease [Gemmatimonadota bacterium]
MTILEEWSITPEQLTDLLGENPSLRGMLFGYVAELKLKERIAAFPEVSSITKFDDHDRKKKGDFYILYKNRAFSLELKSLQTASIKYEEENSRWSGKAQVDASDKRTITLPDGSEMDTTLLLRGEFDILAVNCYAFNNEWNFVFARNQDLPCSTYSRYTQIQRENLIASLITVTWPPKPPFDLDIRYLLDKMIAEGGGSNPIDI